MDDEFKLCWKNFQDNIATGFQSLYDRGDLVDVTLACDGKLLQAHKIVLAICSPYFQEIFITNPCKHPIIILKDVSYTIMCELLEFMYQGVVNVKHTELQAFMKIGQLLQIKGLATNSSSSAASSSADKSNLNQNTNDENETSTQQTANQNTKSAASPAHDLENSTAENTQKPDRPTLTMATNSNPNTPQRSQSPVMSPASPSLNISTVSTKSNDSHSFHAGPSTTTAGATGASLKRHLSDFSSETLSIYSRNKLRRSLAATDHSSDNNDGSEMGANSSMDQMNTDDFFLPHMSMVEQRYDLSGVKRESAEHHMHSNGPSAAAAAAAAASLRNSFNPAAFGLDYTFYKNGGGGGGTTSSGQEYPNDLNASADFKGFANHMDIPPNCPNVVMLSSTSLLHGNCVFNRNNTVATQQGMKTYWLCKSYRISMCRARCITHQGKIISATGVHNHPPHMRGNSGAGSNSMGPNGDAMSAGGNSSVGGGMVTNNTATPQSQQMPSSGGGLRFAQNMASPGVNMYQASFHGQHHGHPMSPTTPPSMHHHPHSAAGDPTTSMHPTTSHHFATSMSNLAQHQSSHQLMAPATVPNLAPPLQQPSNSAIQTIMHGSAVHSPQTHAGGYDMSPPISATDHSRLVNQAPTAHDAGERSLRAHLNDDHIPVHNAAELSPSHSGLAHVNEDRERQRLNESEHQSEHHPSHPQHQSVQVIDSITISPGGNGHNFKIEPL